MCQYISISATSKTLDMSDVWPLFLWNFNAIFDLLNFQQIEIEDFARIPFRLFADRISTFL
jgi:hypothetical protein